LDSLSKSTLHRKWPLKTVSSFSRPENIDSFASNHNRCTISWNDAYSWYLVLLNENENCESAQKWILELLPEEPINFAEIYVLQWTWKTFKIASPRWENAFLKDIFMKHTARKAATSSSTV